jgi:hypothetical protein
LDARHALVGGGVVLGSDSTPKLQRRAWRYDAVDRTFSSLEDLPGPRLAAALATDGTMIWLLGGEDKPRNRAAEVWQFPVPPRAAK